VIDVALVTLIKQHAGTADRVHSGGERVELTRDLPKIVYTLIGLDRLYCDDGNVGLVKGRYQLDIFAATPTAARTIADNIRVGLDGYAGTVDGTTLLRVYFDSERMQPPQQPVGQASTAARFTQDLIVDYRERVS
jgi:hypothetical protein